MSSTNTATTTTTSGIVASWLFLLFLLAALSSAQQTCTEIANHNFTVLSNNEESQLGGQRLPAQWSWAIGRYKGNGGPITQVVVDERNGVTLRNALDTTRFVQLHQFFTVDSSTSSSTNSNSLLYELEARHVITSSSSGGGNTAPDNAYVKLASVDETGDTPEFDDRSRLILSTFPNTTHGSLLGYVGLEPGGRARVSMFYDGLGGSMAVRSLCVQRVDTDNIKMTTNALIRFINRHYSYFGIRGPTRTDFVAQTSYLQSNVTNQQMSTVQAVQQVLGILTRTDPHVYMRTTDGTVILPLGFETRQPSSLWESTFAVSTGRLQDAKSWRTDDNRNTLAFTGLLQMMEVSKRQVVYLLLTSLAGEETKFDQIRQSVKELLAKTNNYEMILDLRYNLGGNEDRGLELVRDIWAAGSDNPLTNTQQVYYATNSFRLDPDNASRFYQVRRSPVTVPTSSRTQVVVLTSRDCVSSCEGLVLALRATGATLVGEHTGGASGNPQPFVIPNVGQVFVSTWKAGNAQGEPFEVIGIAPDVSVNGTVTTSSDPVLDAAISLLDDNGGGDQDLSSAGNAKQGFVMGALFVSVAALLSY